MALYNHKANKAATVTLRCWNWGGQERHIIFRMSHT